MISISIIVPTFNRARTLKQTLKSIYAQANLEECEIIVVDNGSTDNTKQICDDFLTLSPPTEYFYDAEPGLLTGRHLGALKAKGDILCFLDDDVELSTTWLSGVRDVFSNSSAALATGPSLPKYEQSPPYWVQNLWVRTLKNGRSCHWLSLLDLGNEEMKIDAGYVWGLNFCIRKSVLLSLGGFHPDNMPAHLQKYQGDGESGLSMKANTCGFQAVYKPQIKVHHNIAAERLTVSYFEKRAFYQGVANSFTTLKEEKSAKLKLPYPAQFLKYVKRSLKKVYNVIAVPKELREINSLLRSAEQEGFVFHQNAFQTDIKVREWVLRKDYWDYKLPQ